MKKYIIVYGNGLDRLSEHVCDAMKNGYRPVGGPFACSGQERMTDRYAQAMVLA
jgi:hypothetical protein